MMKSIRLLTVFFILSLNLGCMRTEPLEVSDAWVRASAPGQEIGAAYMTLTSRSDMTLSKVDSPAAGSVEIHMMSMEDGIMRMRMVDTLPLKADEAVMLEPGGYHLMLFDLKQPLKPDTTNPFKLHLQDTQGKTIEFSISVPVRNASS